MDILDGIAPLAPRYDGFVLDLWGVVHDGRRPYPGVVEALARLREAGKRVAFLSNAPRRAWVVERQLAGMGIGKGAHYDGVITSGELVWRHLARREDPFFARLGRRVFHIGPERDHSVIEGLDLAFADSPAQAEWVLNTGPDPQRGPKSVAPYEETLAACAAHGLPMVCANPDLAVMVAGERLICAGALAARYRALGGAVVEIGKPDPAVYAPVLDLLGVGERARVVAIGDSPHTDLAGAQAAGLAAVWALTGLAADAHGEDPSPERLRRALEEHAVEPLAALRALRW
ncbi:TIGR01459 family HAD-type hydrolase [Caldovatus aquaticus]|uniref:TIGR01459 family HAD-type hydrolase n=1 Tax=Caldovatus aquaticus TaxID=2865671 RepID=A0ABS7F440_9PROT|nr:TIGR01459 family HAD-type hydrolase [Caldovatus aquaticus]MBW8270377.1 TIGR01459 family HAD-type hydrolase [Caldovatus aquaticus]